MSRSTFGSVADSPQETSASLHISAPGLTPGQALAELGRYRRRVGRAYREYRSGKVKLEALGVEPQDAAELIASRRRLERARAEMEAIDSLAAEARVFWPVSA